MAWPGYDVPFLLSIYSRFIVRGLRNKRERKKPSNPGVPKLEQSGKLEHNLTPARGTKSGC